MEEEVKEYTEKDITPKMKREILKLYKVNGEHRYWCGKKDQAIIDRKYGQLYIIDQKLREIERNIINDYLTHLNSTVVDLNDLIKDMPEEDRTDLRYYSNAIILMADILETMVDESNRILQRTCPLCKIEMFNKMIALNQECKSQLQHMCNTTSEKFQWTFADYTNDLTNLILNKAKSLIRKVDKNNEH